MLVVETVVRIRREHAAGKAIKAIARDLRLSRKVVRTANNFVRTRMNAHAYWLNALAYAEGRHRAWSDAAHRAAMAEQLKRLQGMAEAAG